MREAAMSSDGGSARCVIISVGLGNLRDKNYYSESAVRSAVKLFPGKQAYINHPSESEEQDRPERSVTDLAGYWLNTTLGTVKDADTGESLLACMGTLKFDLSESGRRARDLVATALDYQKRFPNAKDVYCGISINGGGVSHPAMIDGEEVNMVTEIQEAFSADIVTKPARGGKFLALLESHRSARRRKTRPFGRIAIEAKAIFMQSYRNGSAGVARTALGAFRESYRRNTRRG
jgi:hypothetical protein